MTGDFNSRINKLNECVTFDYESFHELQFDEAIADILSDEESLERLDIPVVRKTEDNVGAYVIIMDEGLSNFVKCLQYIYLMEELEVTDP